MALIIVFLGVALSRRLLKMSNLFLFLLKLKEFHRHLRVGSSCF